MTEWIVRRWARFGHERLYAETPGGTALGYLDLRTGQYHSDDASNLPLLTQAVSDHLAAQQPTVSVTPLLSPSSAPVAGVAEVDVPARQAAPEETLGPSGLLPAWTDLSARPAGVAARARAQAEREAQGWFRHGLARVTGARTEERAWRIGADGEQAVAEQLAKLGPEWHCLHAVPVGERGSDIDHVVVGPAGVFTVNAKNHPHASVWVGGNTFLVNGHRVPYIRNSRHEARRASQLLTVNTGFPVLVVGVVAVVGAHKGFTVKQQPEDGQVVVVPRRRISQHLRRQQARLSAREIDAIYEVAQRSTTWHR